MKSTIPKQIAQIASDTGFTVDKIKEYDYDSRDIEFELFFSNGFIMFLSVDMDGNVIWWDFNKKFEMGNIKNPQRLEDSFYRMLDSGTSHKEIRFEESVFDKFVNEMRQLYS